jgi:hypothetical protein
MPIPTLVFLKINAKAKQAPQYVKFDECFVSQLNWSLAIKNCSQHPV